MKLEYSKLERFLIDYFSKVELLRRNRNNKDKVRDVLPKHILKRHILIITNGEVVFDSNEFKNTGIPLSIQYSIKQYGYPQNIKPNNKTPLIYNITSKATAIF